MPPQERLKEYKVTEEELNAVSKKYSLSPKTLLAPLPTEGQRAFQKEALLNLKEFSTIKELEPYKGVIHNNLQWALKLNESGHVQLAQELREGLVVMAKLSQGVWDSAVEKGMEKMVGSLTALGLGKGFKTVLDWWGKSGNIKVLSRWLGMFALPGQIAFATWELSNRRHDLADHFTKIIEAIEINNFREVGRYTTKLGLEIADAFFMVKSLASLINAIKDSDIKNKIIESFKNSLVSLKEAQTGLTINAQAMSNYWGSKSRKYFEKHAKKLKTCMLKFKKRIKNICEMVDGERNIHSIMEQVHQVCAKYRQVKVPGLQKPLTFDWDHLFKLDRDLTGFHFDHKNVVQNGGKVKFHLVDLAPHNGWYRALVEHKGRFREKSFFCSNTRPMETISEIVEKLKQTDFSKIPIGKNGIMEVPLQYPGGKIMVYVNSYTSEVMTIYPKHDNWRGTSLVQQYLGSKKL